MPPAHVRNSNNISTSLLPFKTHAHLQSLDAWIGLRSIVSLGVSAWEFGAMAEAHLDMPVLHANVTPVSNVDSNCDPLPASKSLYQKLEEHVLDTAICIDTAIGIDFGASAEGELGTQVSWQMRGVSAFHSHC
jgi:hypothetical protein